MTIPPMNKVLVPCLKFLSAGARNAQDCLPGLKAEFSLTEAEMEEAIPSGQRRRIFDRADWGIFHLMKAGLVERPERGVYKITAAGQVLLDQGVTSLTLSDLRKMPVYADAMKKAVEANENDNSDPAATVVETNPEDAIKAAHALLDAAVREDLLSRLVEVHPIRFERLILDLLSAMGFGGGDLSRTQMTQVTGDGGIDGIIHEDALGLDRVYLQAKRYAQGNNIGSPAIYQFAGSLTARGAAKGVFVTTSDFTKDARNVASNITQHRIVLIDGQELARLMIRYGVGVRTRTTYVVSGIDEDYFAET